MYHRIGNKSPMKKIILPFTIIAAFATSCENPEKQSVKNAKTMQQFISPANFDTAANPADNFYQYINGNWLKENPIPATEASWNNFSIIQDNNLTNLRNLLEEAASGKNEAGSGKRKLGDFYATAMDSSKLNAERLQSLQPEFKVISDLKSAADLPAIVAYFHKIGVRPFFEIGVGPDSKASNQNIFTLGQGG